MHRIVWLIIISLSLASCATICPKPAAQGISSDKFLDYQPIPPSPALKVLYYNEKTKKFEEKFWDSFPDSTEGNTEKRHLLPIQSAYTYVTNDDVSGKLSYLTNAVSAEGGNYTVTSDYILYRVERVEGVGVGLVGVGMRVRAKIHTTKGGLNLGGLFNLALDAQAKSLTGRLEVTVIGISSDSIIQIFPAMSADISPQSISQVMQALAAIKTKISDPDVEITPYLLAFKQSKAGMESRIVGSLAYMQGMQQGTAQLNQIAEIVGYVATDTARWQHLVDASNLSAAQKRQWKAVAVQDVFDRLRHDTALGHDVLPKLYTTYKKLKPGGK